MFQLFLIPLAKLLLQVMSNRETLPSFSHYHVGMFLPMSPTQESELDLGYVFVLKMCNRRRLHNHKAACQHGIVLRVVVNVENIIS